MSSPLDDLSHSHSIQSLIAYQIMSILILLIASLEFRLLLLFLDTLLVDKEHLLVVELNQVIHYEVIPILEDLNRCYSPSQSGVIDGSIFASQVEEHVLALLLQGDVQVCSPQCHAILIP